ncbi:hypothetical protein BLNAU_20662 [Blattamonas nauphoetae]|uniref:Uncharacterized protein n=1 Tax=Blattamonas nauphoetae TaxID=2049346 RepID=A0ABQ9WY65_9EUKA|nr:hypothetical protein BLNAU_20662 [Blattamonas nauphoetae]
MSRVETRVLPTTRPSLCFQSTPSKHHLSFPFHPLASLPCATACTAPRSPLASAPTVTPFVDASPAFPTHSPADSVSHLKTRE